MDHIYWGNDDWILFARVMALCKSGQILWPQFFLQFSAYIHQTFRILFPPHDMDHILLGVMIGPFCHLPVLSLKSRSSLTPTPSPSPPTPPTKKIRLDFLSVCGKKITYPLFLFRFELFVKKFTYSLTTTSPLTPPPPPPNPLVSP